MVYSQYMKALKEGRLKKPNNCQECGCESKIEGHHQDYFKPLSVLWLCRKCHGKYRGKSKNYDNLLKKLIGPISEKGKFLAYLMFDKNSPLIEIEKRSRRKTL